MNITKYLRMLVVLMTVTLCFGLWSPQPASAQIKLKVEFYDFKVKEVGGTYVILKFKSRHPVIPSVAISEKHVLIKPGGKSVVFANPQSEIAASAFGLLAGYRESHEYILKDIKPGTKYYVGIIGYRKSGTVYLPLLGNSFTTLKRKVGFQFTKIEMIDDSDDLSDGEFKFGFFVYDYMASGSPPPMVSLYTPPLSQGAAAEHVIGSGDDRDINLIENLFTEKMHFKIEATAVDDDEDGLSFWESFAIFLGTGVFIPVTGNEGGTGVGVSPHAGSGDESFAEWATASQDIRIENITNMNQLAGTYAEREQYQIPFILHANPAGVDLEFKVYGQVNVSYQ